MTEDNNRNTQRIDADQMAKLHEMLSKGSELTLTVTPDVLARIGALLPVIEETEGLESGSLTVDAGATRILMVGLGLLEG